MKAEGWQGSRSREDGVRGYPGGTASSSTVGVATGGAAARRPQRPMGSEIAAARERGAGREDQACRKEHHHAGKPWSREPVRCGHGQLRRSAPWDAVFGLTLLCRGVAGGPPSSVDGMAGRLPAARCPLLLFLFFSISKSLRCRATWLITC